ncbi:MAG: hypothetical protein ACOYT9_03730, partial [Patescibacteria group bacterium]
MDSTKKQAIPFFTIITFNLLCVFVMVLFNNTSTIQVQEIVISITLAINIAAIFIFKDARLSISLTVISAQTLLLVVWGNSIPYIHLITVIPYYLLL